MPKLRRMFSSVSAPFCWPTTATGRPSSREKPATIAASSPNRRSPWSSTTSVGHGLDELERVRPLDVARQLDPRPDVVGRGPLPSSASDRGTAVRAEPRPHRASSPAARSPSARPSDRNDSGRDAVADPAFVAAVGRRGRQIAAAAPASSSRSCRVGHDPVDEAVARTGTRRAGSPPAAPARSSRPATRAPAKPISAFGSARLTSPSGRERGKDAAGGRVGQHADVGHAGVAQALERGARLGQLHQRQRAFLHPRAAGRATTISGIRSRARTRRRG